MSIVEFFVEVFLSKLIILFFLVDEQILSLASLGLSCLALKKLARRKAFGNDTCQVKRTNVSNRVKGFMIRWYTNKAGLLGLLLISNSAEYSRFFFRHS